MVLLYHINKFYSSKFCKFDVKKERFIHSLYLVVRSEFAETPKGVIPLIKGSVNFVDEGIAVRGERSLGKNLEPSVQFLPKLQKNEIATSYLAFLVPPVIVATLGFAKHY